LNGVENAETTWLLKDANAEVLKSLAGNLSNTDIDFTEKIGGMELYNKDGLYFEIRQ
jgi:hypothetical protein